MTDVLKLISDNSQIKQNMAELICPKIRALVTSGQIPPETQLPSEVELAEAFGVSRTTIREALNILQREGTVIRRQGIGTFVTKQSLLPNRLDRNFGVTELIESLGRKPGTKSMAFNRMSADDYWADLLDVPVNTTLLEFERVRTADGRPVVYSIDVLSVDLINSKRGPESIDIIRRGLENGVSIYQVLDRDFGLRIDNGIATIKPLLATADISHKLDVDVGTLMMFMSQSDYDFEGSPLLASHEYHLAEAYAFSVFRKR